MSDVIEPDDDDRKEWDAAWSAQTLRSIPGGPSPSWISTLGREFSSAFVTPDRVAQAMLFAIPEQYTGGYWIESEVCPVCGGPTLADSRLEAALTMPRTPLKGVWVHKCCFAGCSDTKTPAPIPW